MTLTQLRALVLVVEAGSFSRAAGMLGVSQSAVSHAIAGLETELGATLLRREHGRIVPTAAGKLVLPHAEEMLAREGQVRRDAAMAAGHGAATLRVGGFASARTRLLPEMLVAYRRRYPEVEVEVSVEEGADAEVLERIRIGAVDLGFVILPTVGLKTVPVGRDDLLAVLPAGHRLARTAVVPIVRLADDPFILSTGGCGSMIEAAFRAAGVAPRVSMALREVGTILAMVRAGLGVTIVPALALPAEAEGLAARPLDPPVYRHLALAARSWAASAPAARAFLELAGDRSSGRGAGTD